MSDEIEKHITKYRNIVKSLNKETPKKEAFKDLLNRIYHSSQDILKIIDSITKGSEITILNIPRKDRIHRGSADSLFNNVIIEFETDLKKHLKHAKEQLAGYLLGSYNTSNEYNFTLIATDCITWKVFSPDFNQIADFPNLIESEVKLDEIPSASFVLDSHNSMEFYYWLDRFLFKENKQKATLKKIEEAFGYQSNVFIESFVDLSTHFEKVKMFGDVQVAFEQWKVFLSIAYGSFDASEKNFIIHSYLSIFSKMLAYSIVSNDEYIDEDELKQILSGNIFKKYNIANFTDNDFFHWVGSNRNFRSLLKMFRRISQEISTFHYQNIDEDILKGVYQELIEIDTRHNLGEYYTPDWLCERIVQEYDFTTKDRILDPSCGSGSFLRAAIHRKKALNPNITIEELSNSIYGIDIHPLSVQIAKTTLLIAFGQDIVSAKRPIYINIILANTLLAPEGVNNLFGDEFIMQIDKNKLWLNTDVFEDVQLFDVALEVCESLAELTINKPSISKDSFTNNLRLSYPNGGITRNITDSFYQIYESLKLVKESGRDSIWKFIVQNFYKPYFLNKKFDYIVGNPPWFTYSDIKNEDYQIILNNLADKYKVKPDKVSNFPHLEIAAIFLSHCSSFFLRENGKIAFVLPRSFMSADHHDNTRAAKAKGYNIVNIWDLNNVNPLFNIPSCVFFGIKAGVTKPISKNGLMGLSFSGRVPKQNCNYNTAKEKLIEDSVVYYYSKQGKSSAFTTKLNKTSKKINYYKDQFRQGATIVPRSFYFVELNQKKPLDWSNRLLNLRTDRSILKESKKPWQGIEFIDQIESKFLFATAISKSILPFALFRPSMVVLPIVIESVNHGDKFIKLLTPSQLLQLGFMHAAKWFQIGENIWDTLKTENNKEITSTKYLNWQNKLTDQDLNANYMVIYNASAKDANATIVSRSDFDLTFIVESKAYVYYTNQINEAYYICAFLNSTIPNLLMKDFQSRGLFGARDVHKKILDIYLPKFDNKSSLHNKLSSISAVSHEKAKEFVSRIPESDTIEGIKLGKLRLDLKKHLASEIKQIDDIVMKLIQ